MLTQGDSDAAVARLEKLFPVGPDGSDEYRRRMALGRDHVEPEIWRFLRQWNNPGSRTAPFTGNIRIENVHSVLVSAKSQNLLQDAMLRAIIIEAAIRVDGVGQISHRAVETGLIRNHDEWQLNANNLPFLANPGMFRKGARFRAFLETFEFPLGFEPPDKVEEKNYFANLRWSTFPDLVEYQSEVASLVRDVLERNRTSERGTNRGLVALPTGAGKTRVVVDSLLRWYLEAEDPPVIMWICHTAELADQAEESIRRTWQSLCFGDTDNPNQRDLRLHRFWSDTGWGSTAAATISVFSDPVDREKGGIVICLIQTLHQIARRAQWTGAHKTAFEGLENPDCLVVDEAHRFETKMYRETLTSLGIEVRINRKEQSEIPIIGMTATPWNTDDKKQRNMYRRYDRFLLPEIVDEVDPDPADVRSELMDLRQCLVADRILSRAYYRPLNLPGGRIQIRQKDRDEFGDLNDAFLRRLMNDRNRSMAIVDDIVDIIQKGTWKSMIVYSMSVSHAHAIACELRLRGVSSDVITGVTRPRDRYGIINAFRAGETSVLCNHSVLTVGFDAPNTDVIYITRPVYSPIMLEQIVGRGLRGVKFGGTERCLVVTPQDRLILERRLGGGNIVLAQDEIERILLIDEEE